MSEMFHFALFGRSTGTTSDSVLGVEEAPHRTVPSIAVVTAHVFGVDVTAI